MARVIPCSLLGYRWMNIELRSNWSGRSMCLEGARIEGRSSMSRRRLSKPFSLVNLGGNDNLLFGNKQFCKVRRPLVSSHAHLTPNFKKTGACYSLNGTSSTEGLRFLNTNVTVNLTHQIVQLDAHERQIPDQGSLRQNTEEQQKDEVADLVTSVVEGKVVDASAEADEIFVATLEVSVAGDIEKELAPISNPDTPAVEGNWWHIPDSIAQVLPLPADFEERQEVLFERFGSQIDSLELLLRVLVHKSYYDQRVPAFIKDREYLKPHSPMFIDSGEVKHQDVKGLPSTTISCMTFGDAHGEVRSQLAILGDAIIGLAVSSLLVRQHSSAGTITERKCQLVSNSNLSRVWRTLLGPREFVLSFGDSSSQPAAQSRMMADSCEAYIGALYTEKGFDTAYNCVTNALLPLLVQADSARNPVHSLNVHSSMAFQVLPEYRLIGVDNENTHRQVCRVRVYVKGIRMATGMGVNQKLARLDAARKALEKWPQVFRVV